uniref:Large ribosomal subunit protein uL13c n=1 Tax=Biddulphiella tridens TaxID=1003022 RepID=A0A2U9NSX7_9STRA|nr:ribosomal protein L13 [Biddulphia tridens]AWT40243.1 ribosomal protein L13 [Biddulphia tridens]
MNKTFIPDSDYIKRKWYIIDCKDQQLGRLASSLISLLSGKFKSYYYPSIDTGDYVILINVESLIFNQEIERFHVFQPGRPGRSLKKMGNPTPQRIIENCIKCMMPNGLARKRLTKRLKVYEGANHPHQAQNPIKLDFNKL